MRGTEVSLFGNLNQSRSLNSHFDTIPNVTGTLSIFPLMFGCTEIYVCYNFTF
uniref:Uncharacterized protein n=2 Tax=Anguilla anguilla TaxID=7936 RepID=A0A0E9S371_ANGAN